MKTNLVICGENEKINKGVGEKISPMLDLNFLDFDSYCEYLTMATREQIIKDYGKDKYEQIQNKHLPKTVDFCNSVIGFDANLLQLPKIYELLHKTSIIVCIANKEKTQLKEYCDIWINLGKKTLARVASELIRKLGEMYD